ncbi:hypothetical protein [Tsukamurella tyrosinosolvens]|uniref:hypothetical protein n=1 Tax=Tsukamurella tyrosinosolvens TaxID=57704 RepID=UPI003461F5B1
MKGRTYLYPDARRALVKALSGKGDASVLLDGDYLLTVHHDSCVSVRELSAQDIEACGMRSTPVMRSWMAWGKHWLWRRSA